MKKRINLASINKRSCELPPEKMINSKAGVECACEETAPGRNLMGGLEPDPDPCPCDSIFYTFGLYF